MFGVEAAGQSIEVPDMTRYRIEDGAVQTERGIVDNLGLMQQLGAFSPYPPSNRAVLSRTHERNALKQGDRSRYLPLIVWGEQHSNDGRTKRCGRA